MEEDINGATHAISAVVAIIFTSVFMYFIYINNILLAGLTCFLFLAGIIILIIYAIFKDRKKTDSINRGIYQSAVRVYEKKNEPERPKVMLNDSFLKLSPDLICPICNQVNSREATVLIVMHHSINWNFWNGLK